MITVNNLTHDFLDTRALDNVSFSINSGAIVALIGPNGSGKTTLMRCISTLQSIQQGEIIINNINITDDPRTIHKHIGYLADNFGLYDDLTVEQALIFTAHSRLGDVSNINDLVTQCAVDAGVIDFIDKKINTLSRGMRQRVGIAQAIIHQPKLLLLDEPASGLDPEARISLSQLLIDLKNKGMTLIVSSHILAELEDYSTEMLILREGKLIEHTLLKDADNNVIRSTILTIKVLADNLTTEIVALFKITFPAVSGVIYVDNELIFNADAEQTKQHELLNFLMQQGVAIKEFAEVKRNLQDEYLKTIKKS